MATEHYHQPGCPDINPQWDCACQMRTATEEEVLRSGGACEALSFERDLTTRHG